MQLKRTLALAVAILALSTSAAFATVITPTDAVPAVNTSPAFGGVVAGGVATNQYGQLGLIFNPGVAIFNDLPLAWGGINAGGIVDLLAPVGGSFVVPNTATPALVGFLSVEGGFSDVGALLLRAFDINGALLGSTVNDDGTGPHGRTLMTLAIPGIHSFIVSTPGQDSFGVDQIEYDRLTAAVPEPTTLLLLGTGVASLVARRRRRV